LPEDIKQTIIRLTEEKFTNKAIVEQCKVSASTIKKVRAQHRQVLKELENNVPLNKPKAKTTNSQRAVIRVLVAEGQSQKYAARKVKVSQSTASRALKRFSETSHDEDRPRVGRPRLSTPRDDRVLERLSLNNRFRPATRLKEDWEQSGMQAGVHTVRRRLSEFGLSGRVARKKPLLTAIQKARRLAFAKKHASWTAEDWEAVLWTDESPFSIFGECGKTYVRRRVGEEFDEQCLQPTVKHGGGKIQVWGCFTAHGVGHLHRITGIMDQHVYKQILVHHLRPSLRQLGGMNKLLFQQDNDPKHTAKSIQSYIKQAGYKCLEDWPSQSPDLNPIENLWQELNRLLRQMRPLPKNKDDLFKLLEQAWEEIPQDTLKALVHSMPRRIQAVIEAKGGHTKY
jgi:transposase